ncbi:PH domain-containing protein [Haloarcula japonica]|uniref:PH domain-containing protein n=1 Tax=Haloarcula japonica TaxID=29282 RepID=UPI0039F69E6D
MGLFGSSDEDENTEISDEVQELVENAKHPSVTAKKLTEKSPNIRGHMLAEKPLLEYLEEGEQPHLILHSATPGGIRIKMGGEKKKILGGSAAVMITNLRVVLAKGVDESDEISSIPIEGISGGETKQPSKLNPTKNTHKLILYADLNSILAEATDIDKDEVDDIMNKSIEAEVRIAFDKVSKDDTKFALKYISTKAEEFTNIQHKDKINEYIDDDEDIIQILKGKVAEIKQGEETDSRYAGKGVYTVITDKRVFAVIGQRIKGTDIQNLSYDSIDAVNLDKGIVNTFVSIDSGGRTYRFNAYDNSEAKEAVDYIRKRTNGELSDSSESDTPDSDTETEGDTAERLEELESLHQKGVLTDEEYESKRQEIIGEI